ncbi:MAG: endo-1,4-beta-xylanase [Terriglobia bacterium]
MTRREVLKMAAGLGSAAISGPGSERAAGATGQRPSSRALPGSLRDSASARGLQFGAAVPWQELVDNPAYAELVAQQCGILVPEVELKWNALRPTPEEFDFRSADQLCAFASSHGMLFRGHTLIWERALPKWFMTVVNTRNAELVMMRHISTVVSHFAGKMHSWDVVNEAIQLEDGRPDGLKVTPWLRYLGPEYIEIAFHAAHAADPNAMLVYNENWLEPENAAAERRRQAVLTLLTQLRRHGVPVHALGVQSHLCAEMQTTGPDFKRFLQAIEDLGLTIALTEMDVRDQRLPGNIEERDRLVATQYEDYLSFVLQFQSLKTIMTWGLTDRFTWLATIHPRPDGLPVRPLPYDADLNPKPSWGAIRGAFETAPPRVPTT